jgi:hypothetical protein
MRSPERSSGEFPAPFRDVPDWDDPDRCPFCGAELADGGVGFIDHTDETSDCKERFEGWREGVIDDIGGEWGG